MYHLENNEKNDFFTHTKINLEKINIQFLIPQSKRKNKTMQQQYQHAEYYDKLLHHLNRTFAMNIKAQELFLDLSRHTKTIRFKSIKNIYSTLTQGKADEVIYQKDKEQLISNHVFNQKFTQRTCWRIIQKLITKISYYLSNEHMLASIAPSIIKIISFLRNANEKINNRASFVQFFQEVLDCVIAENNILEQKIYDLLIKRGYIYSIDEFYRLNRFEGPHTDYVCPVQPDPSDAKEQEEYSLEVAGKSIETSSAIMSKKSRSRFGLFSSKKSAAHNRSRTNMQQSNIPQEELNADMGDSESEVEQDDIKVQEFNRLSHNIHQQVEKTVDQLLNNNNFETYINSNRSQDHVSSLHDSNTKSTKPSIMKQLLKNLKNRNFKANQKILIINSSIQKGKEEERKNSSQTLLKKKKKHRDGLSLQKNRTSIAMALNKGMRERIFKNQHLADIQDLIINNLDKLESGMDSQNQSNVNQKGLNKKNIYFRTQVRQHTQILPIHNEQTTGKSARRASNIQFLNNAFNFQGKMIPKNSFNELRRVSNFGPQWHMSEISSNRTIQTPSFQQKLEFIEKYVHKTTKTSKNTHRKNKRSNLTLGQQGFSRFASQFKELPPKQNRFFCHTKGKTDEFNPTLLKITAQKYNKCVTQQPQTINTLQLKELNSLTGINQLANLTTESSLKSKSKISWKNKMAQVYHHHRKFEVFDRKLRRML